MPSQAAGEVLVSHESDMQTPPYGEVMVAIRPLMLECVPVADPLLRRPLMADARVLLGWPVTPVR